MDQFKSQSMFYKCGPYDNLSNKSFGRRNARRSSKQISAQWLDEYDYELWTGYDFWNTWDENDYWCGNYDYDEMEDIYNRNIEYYYELKEHNVNLGWDFQSENTY